MKLRLSDDEEKVVQLLRESGALTPSEISVKTLMRPNQMKAVLYALEDLGYVVMRDTPDIAEGRLVLLSSEMQDILLIKQQRSHIRQRR